MRTIPTGKTNQHSVCAKLMSCWRFVVFGLDLFNTAYRRSRFDFNDPSVLARLEPMTSVIGNTLYSSHMQVVVAGLKAAASIVKSPLKSIDKSLPVFIRQTIEIIRQSGSTESESVQAAFKSLAAILRDHPGAQVKEKDLVYLLELLAPDLEEPNRQATVFTMLRAIIARRFVVPEIYDLMDKVAEIMVTNQSPQVQELSRGAMLQFLLDYPQGKGRLKNQMTFLVKNLSYVYESGRKSVMDLLGAMIAKFETVLVQEYADLLFVGLVMVIANDESAKCREMAAELIKGLLGRLDSSQRNVIMSHVHTWAVQQAQPQLTRVSAQVYGLVLDFLGEEAAIYIPAIMDDMKSIIARSAAALELANEEDADGADVSTLSWQTPYHSLLAISKVLRVKPALVAEPNIVDWPSIISLLLFPHAWVRTAACRLLGSLFAAVPAGAPQATLPDDSPFSRAGMEDVASKLSVQLNSENLDEALSVQIVKNLFYLGKCFAAMDFKPKGAADVDGQDDDEDDEDDGAGPDDNAAPKRENGRHPLPWLFSRLSYQASAALIRRRNKATSAVCSCSADGFSTCS